MNTAKGQTTRWARGRVAALGLLAPLLLVGCVTAVDVKLRHPDGREAVCAAGIRRGVFGATLGQDQVRDCVADCQRQGFVRVPD